jgi:type VI secretion system FHA domain protein
MVTAENGRYILTDLSSNGIYINGSSQATSRHSRVPLKEGDTLRMGNYLLTVVELSDSNPPIANNDASGQPRQNDPLDLESISSIANPAFQHPVAPVQSNPRGEDPFDSDSLRASREVHAGEDLFRGRIPSTAWQGAPQADHVPAPAQAAPRLRVVHSEPRQKIDIDDLIGELVPASASSMPRIAALPPVSAASSDSPPTLPQVRPDAKATEPARAKGPKPAEKSATAFEPERVSTTATASDSHGALLAFLEGAGVPMERTNGRDPEMVLRTAGQIFRAMAEGIREILLSRSALKGEMGILQTLIQADGNNALKFSVTAAEAVASLLAPARPGYKDPLAAAEEAFADIKQHELAVIVGVRSALDGLLRRFDPNTLEQRLSRHKLLDTVLPSARKARYWDVFRAIYSDISREAEDDFQSLFGRAFAKAYMAQTRKD